MIKIVLKRQGDVVRRLTVNGHAGFSDEEHGGDIVCSAVSALVGYLGITFSEVLPHSGTVQAEDGFFELNLTAEQALNPIVVALLEAWRRSVLQLEENYRGWVKVEEQN
jgi:uncharacterized protein YsxB (DUF464 family)